jgi:hypothetical protein
MDTGLKTSGGEGGIRTPDTLSGMPVFKTGAINHSATSPRITINNLAITQERHRKFAASCYARFHAPLARRLSLHANSSWHARYLTTTIKDGISKPVQKSKSDCC